MIDRLYVSSAGGVWAAGGPHLWHLTTPEWKEVKFDSGPCEQKWLMRSLGVDQNDISRIGFVTFADETHGWLAFSNGSLERTTDGGRTWCDLLSPQHGLDAPGEPLIFAAMHFSSPLNGIALSAWGGLYQTVDGGSLWARLETKEQLRAVSFNSPNEGLAIGDSGAFRITPRNRGY